MMWLVVCGEHGRLCNITTQVLILANRGDRAVIEQLRKLNNELFTEVAELMTGVRRLRDEYLGTRNESPHLRLLVLMYLETPACTPCRASKLFCWERQDERLSALVCYSKGFSLVEKVVSGSYVQ
jgi:hypothetical protein